MTTKFWATIILSTAAIVLLSSFKLIKIDAKDIVGAWGYGP